MSVITIQHGYRVDYVLSVTQGEKFQVSDVNGAVMTIEPTRGEALEFLNIHLSIRGLKYATESVLFPEETTGANASPYADQKGDYTRINALIFYLTVHGYKSHMLSKLSVSDVFQDYLLDPPMTDPAKVAAAITGYMSKHLIHRQIQEVLTDVNASLAASGIVETYAISHVEYKPKK